MSTLLQKIEQFPVVQRLFSVSKRIILPGFDGLSVYDVGMFFAAGMQNGAITTRASSIAYRFFLGLFPAVLFIMALIPHIPIEGFQEQVYLLVTRAFPGQLAIFVEATIRDAVTRQRTGLLSVTFVFSLYSATRGVLGIIRSFNASYHDFDTHSRRRQWAVSLGLVSVFGLLLLTASVIQIAGGVMISMLSDLRIIPGGIYSLLMDVARVLLVSFMLFLGISTLFYWAPAKGGRYRFLSPGSILATVAVLIVNAGFNIYLSNLNRWNAIFGSLGTIIVLLIWMYANSMVILIAFELNVSISEARNRHDDDGHADYTLCNTRVVDSSQDSNLPRS